MAPAEVEDVLLMHPAVMDVGVVGVPSLEDELPRAYVVLKPGAEVTETELQKHVEGHYPFSISCVMHSVEFYWINVNVLINAKYAVETHLQYCLEKSRMRILKKEVQLHIQ